jgi:dephospho-CoA kinase
MTYRLGLTGSIGMGKSTTAAMFVDAGVPVWDADAAVHRLYAPGRVGAEAVAKAFPQALMPDGSVSRMLLRNLISTEPAIMDHLNAIVHPLVAADRAAFVNATTSPIVVLDIPLLFEIGADADCDGVAVVSAPPELQRARVLKRGMTPAEFQLILDRQMPDAEKRARATWVIETITPEAARRQVMRILAEIQKGLGNA